MQLSCAFPEKKLPEGLGLTGWVPSPALSVQEFKTYLDGVGMREGVDYQRTPCKGGSEQVEMTRSGVEATFIDGRLAWIVASGPKHSKGKRLAVFVPQDIVEVIRKEAGQRKLSMAAL